MNYAHLRRLFPSGFEIANYPNIVIISNFNKVTHCCDILLFEKFTPSHFIVEMFLLGLLSVVACQDQPDRWAPLEAVNYQLIGCPFC